MAERLNARAVFAGCARDCAAILPHVLNNVSRLAELFTESAFAFVENDSRDNTKFMLERWCQSKQNGRMIVLDGLSAKVPVRTVRLSMARNHLISTLCRDFSDFDYVFILDCDDVNAPAIDLDSVVKAIHFLQGSSERAAVFANQPGTYYDLWTLRHPVRCPGDAWEEVFDYATEKHVSDQEAFAQTFLKRIFSLQKDAPPLEVDSAFGGLAIYKMESILRNSRRYLGYKKKIVSPRMAQWLGIPAGEFGLASCEHVAFNLGFRELGQTLHVLPYLMNRGGGGIVFPPSWWRKMLFDLRSLPLTFDPKNPTGRGKVGRNQACPCGSGKRYKHCHGAPAVASSLPRSG